MSSLLIRSLSEGVVDLAPGTEILPKESCSGDLLTAHRRLLGEPTASGLLVRSGEDGRAIGVTTRTASCLSGLDTTRLEPVRLPEDPAAFASVAALILGGFLRLSAPTGLVSGPRAYEAVVAADPGQSPSSLPAHLSIRGLRFAQALGSTDPAHVQNRLYLFNTYPASPRRVGREGGSLVRRSFLESAPPVREGGVFQVRETGRPDQAGWLVWHRPLPEDHETSGDPTHKLYISPRTEDLAKTVRLALPVLAENGATNIKVAATPELTVRPDKMVAYFSSLAAVREASAVLEERLEGVRPHGVPFSAGLDRQGVLSWGIDSKNNGVDGGEDKGESWRVWQTRRLAESLVRAIREGSPTEPWKYALACLSLRGIDDESFCPAPTWRGLDLV